MSQSDAESAAQPGTDPGVEGAGRTDSSTSDNGPAIDDGMDIRRPWYRRISLADVFVVALLAWWGTELTWGAGGRDPHVVSVAAGLCILSLLALRPWKQLPTLTVALAVAIAVAVWIVVLTAPTGLNGANEAATYVVAAATLLAVASWANTEKHVWFVVGAVLIAGFFEFAQAFWPWLGGQTPSTPMVGTFYYLNTFGAFMIPGVILGMSVALSDIKPLRIMGLVIAPLSVAGVVYSTSKGSEIALVIGMVVVTVLGIVVYRLSGLLRAATIWILAAVVCFFLTGPPFFEGAVGSVLPGSSTATRAGSTDVALEGAGARIEWWWNSLSIFMHWPLTGSGFHSIGDASQAVNAPIRSAFVHNGFLQALAEGGLVLAIPFLGACIGIAFVSLRWIWRTLTRPDDFMKAGISVAVLMLMLHSAMDFDWTYPAVLMQFAILAALIIPRRDEVASALRPVLGWATTGVMVASLVAAAVAAWSGNWAWSFPIS